VLGVERNDAQIVVAQVSKFVIIAEVPVITNVIPYFIFWGINVEIVAVVGTNVVLIVLVLENGYAIHAKAAGISSAKLS